MRLISVNTKLVGLLGTPLAQSVSYKIQNEVYEQMGLDYFYIPLEVEHEEDLHYVVDGMRHMNFAGFAITKPYKETIMPFLDELDVSAERMGACNTVSIVDGKLIGYNTDGIGCIRSFQKEADVELEGKTCVSFGAGGAAHAVCFELAAHKAKKIYIVALGGMENKLADELNAKFPGVAVPIAVDDRDAIHTAVEKSQILLNLTGLGMAPHLDKSPLEPEWFRKDQFCFDAIYEPEKSLFLQQAEAAGCKILNGLGMVMYQGLEQIKIWTGVDAPVEIMMEALKK